RGAAGVGGGVQVSEDGGRSWKTSNGGLLDAVREVGKGECCVAAMDSMPSLGPIAASAHFPLVAYVGLRGVALPGRREAQGNGIAKTSDGGRGWSVGHAQADRPPDNLAA